MTTSAVGSAVIGHDSTHVNNTFNMTVTPTTAGNIFVVVASEFNGFFSYGFSVTGGGVTTWNFVQSNGNTGNDECYMWWGVITATGSQTMTIGIGDFGTMNVYCQEFSSTGSGTWTVQAFNSDSSQSGTSGSYPSLMPTSSDGNALYVGIGLISGTTMSGTSGAFTYVNNWQTDLQFVYENSVASPTAYSPGWASVGSSSFTTFLSAVIGFASAQNNNVMIL